MAPRNVTDMSFRNELPRLLAARGKSLRGVADALGGIDHAYLSRMVHGKASVNPHHAERIAIHLGLPSDYFPEVREAAVIAAVRTNSKLRDSVYFAHVGRSSVT